MSDDRPLGRILQLRPVCAAIRGLTVLEFDYRGLHRIVAPYCHGWTRGGESFRGVQIGGESRSGGLGFGKLWLLSETKGVRATGERFAPDDLDYNPDDEAFERIHCRVPGKPREKSR